MNRNFAMIKEGIIFRLKKWTTPPPDENRDELRYWQECIIYSFLLIGMSLGAIVMVQGAILSIKEGLFALAGLNIAVYAWVWVLFFRRSFNFHFRVLSIIVLSYTIGLELLVVTGPFGAGPTWLFFFPVVTGLLLEFRWAMVSLGINLLTIVIFGWLMATGIYDWPFLSAHPLEVWGVICLNFLLLSTIATVAIVIVVRGLQASLFEKKTALDSLEVRNQELQKINLQLVNEISAKKEAQEHLQKSEEALKASEIRFRELVNLLPLAYFLIDSEFILRFINQKAIKAFGFRKNNLDSRFSSDTMYMLIPGDQQHAIENIKRALNGEDIGWIPYTALTENGREFPIEIYAVTVFKGQEVVGVQGLVADITDRLEKETLRNEKNIIEKTNRAISDWVNFIAHEIRNPISGLFSFTQLGLKKLDRQGAAAAFSRVRQVLDRTTDLNPKAIADIRAELDRLDKTTLVKIDRLAGYFQRIFDSAYRLNQLLNELLDLSKLEFGRMPFDMRKANMRTIINEATFELEAALSEKQLQLVIHNTDINTEIECDGFRIGQLIRNLLSNAIKFTPDGKTITIACEESQIKSDSRHSDYQTSAMTVTIADEGIGIPEDQISEVFDKFKQSRKTRKGEGTGLGLPICREIVNAHGGRIWVESIEEHGSRFHFTIPYALEQPVVDGTAGS